MDYYAFEEGATRDVLLLELLKARVRCGLATPADLPSSCYRSEGMHTRFRKQI